MKHLNYFRVPGLEFRVLGIACLEGADLSRIGTCAFGGEWDQQMCDTQEFCLNREWNGGCFVALFGLITGRFPLRQMGVGVGHGTTPVYNRVLSLN